MKLEDIRIRIDTPTLAKGTRGSGGGEFLMEPGEVTNGAWISFERRELAPNERYQSFNPDGSVGPNLPYPEGQTQKVVKIFHGSDESVHEFDLCSPDGIPVARHPLES